MAMDSQDFTFAGAAARLHLLEQKVKSLDPSTPPDTGGGETVTQRLDKLTAALNRCYNWSFAGAFDDNVDANNDLIEYAETGGDVFWFNQNDTNGDGFTETNKNLVSLLFGGYPQLESFKPAGANLFYTLYGSQGWNFLDFVNPVAGVPTDLASACFGSPEAMNEHFLDGGYSLLEENKRLRADLENALSIVSSHEARLLALESAS